MKALLAVLLCLGIASAHLLHNVPPGFHDDYEANKEAGKRLQQGYEDPSGHSVDLLGITGQSGFVVVNKTSGSSMFYWQVDRIGGKIDTDDVPLILWLQGGPGCSSLAGLMFEMGPIYIDEHLNPHLREGTWVEDYHMLFIDNPLGAGYSFAAHQSELITDETQFANHLYYMLQQLSDMYPYWFQSNREFYIFGESYGGHWVPTIAHRIIVENGNIPVTGNNLIPLKGIGIGDGWTDPINQLARYGDFAYSMGLADEVQRANITYYQDQGVAQVNAGFWLEALNSFNLVTSNLQIFTGHVNSTTCGINEYNYRIYCPYNFTAFSDYLNLAATKTLLHVPQNLTYQVCNNDAYNALNYDFMKSVAFNFPLILQHIPVLLYNGQDDYIVNAISAENWISKLKWPGQSGYLNAPKVPWKVGNEIAGFVRSYDNLIQLIVMKAGHLAPHDQINSTRVMVNNFINGADFSSQ